MAKMPKGQSRKLSGEDPELTFDLKEIFGVDFSDKPALKQAIGQAFIDQILERTDTSKSWTGSKFAGYSKSYKASEDFKAFGKTNKVNLRLSGDMLETIDILSDSGNKVVLGWDDQTDASKAHGHITGSVGKMRDFFAVNNSELDSIKSDFRDEIKSELAGEKDFITEAFQSFALDLIGDNDG